MTLAEYAASRGWTLSERIAFPDEDTWTTILVAGRFAAGHVYDVTVPDGIAECEDNWAFFFDFADMGARRYFAEVAS